MEIQKPKPYYHKSKTKYFQNGYEIEFDYIDPDDYWEKYVCDVNRNVVYWEDSNGDWFKKEYNQWGDQIYFEDSNGFIIDKR